MQTQTSNPHDIRCHRGIDLLVLLNFDKQLSTRTCLFIHRLSTVYFIDIKIFSKLAFRDN